MRVAFERIRALQNMHIDIKKSNTKERGTASANLSSYKINFCKWNFKFVVIVT